MVFVAVPAWLAINRLPGADAWRLNVVSALHRPLTAVRMTLASVTGVIRGPVLYLENRRLRTQLAADARDRVQLEELNQEVVRLRRLLRLKESADRPAIAARVIGRDATPWFRTLLIDQGRRGGIAEGAAVVVESGYVGQVYDVGQTGARVLLPTDPRFRVGALVQRTRAQGMAMGTASGRCYLAYLTGAEVVQVGDLIVTSGIGGRHPKGLVIGTVVRIERDPSGLYWQAPLKLSVDQSALEEILCLP